MSRKISIPIVLIALLALLGFGAWTVLFKPSGLPPEGFALGNGRIEADLVDISPRLAGRVAEIKVREGDRVQPGDVLAVMDTAELESQLRRAEAAVASAEANLRARQRAVDAEAAAHAEIAARIADSTLYAQGAGRVLYRLAQPGEILGSGGKLLTRARAQ